MIRDLLKWVAPGVVTVLGGTVAALALSTPAMMNDLSEEGRAALDSEGAQWARFQLDGRDALLSGTTDSDLHRDTALAALAGLPGIGSIAHAVTIAPLEAPFITHVSVEHGAITLSGSAPNAQLIAELAALPGLAAGALEVRAGQPNEEAWLKGVQFALAQAKHLDNGELRLENLTLGAAGQVNSDRALGALEIALANLPAGLSRGQVDLDPVRVKPYMWQAEFDGERIAISGHAPAQAVIERLRVADVSGLPVATGMTLASGAPDGFEQHSRLLIEQLARLDRGEARIVDGAISLSGTPPTIQIAQAVTEALSGTGAIVTLSPPPVTDYWISVNRQAGGVLVFDGYVPDEAARTAFAERDGADVAALKFGGGAPASYRSAVDFGLGLLEHLSEGRFALNGETLALSGVAKSATDFRKLHALLATDMPQGVVAGELSFVAPPAANYEFSAARRADGVVVLSGMVPNPEAERALLALAGSGAHSELTFASGEGANFLSAAQAGMSFLPWLRDGAVRYEGGVWEIAGTPTSAIDKASIEADFAVRGLGKTGWQLALSAPYQAPAIADPYLWSAERLEDGSFLFTGHVPGESLRAALADQAGSRVADTTRIATGAPVNFAAQTKAALEALLALEQGKASFDGANWTLSGLASDEAARTASLAGAEPLSIASPDAVTVQPPEPVEPYQWAASKTAAGRLSFTGAVPADSLRQFLVTRGGPGTRDETIVRPDAPENFEVGLLRALDILALLSEGEVAFDGETWSVSGTGADSDAHDAVTASLGDLASQWAVDLSAPSVAETLAADAPTPQPSATSPVPPTPEPSSAANLEMCREQLATLSDHNAILFQSGAAIIAESAASELDAFAATLALCPRTAVEVEGHTDSDGDDRLNLALSVARAEAVVGALIERGVAPERLYAIGYGESRPVADNASSEGKRRNRRIVIMLRDAGAGD